MTAATSRWEDPTYAALETVLRERAGLVFQALRRSAVETAATRVMERVGIKTAQLFVPMLLQDGAVFDDLMAEVTVGETYFFREVAHFTLLRQRILPAFRERAGKVRRFRAWSAAASTGEEPYSIAIALQEEGIGGDVLGTDISRARLATARHASYRPWSFRGVAQPTIDRYFTKRGDSFELVPSIRRAVELRYLNLASDTYPAMSSGVWGMDAIFCRNVLIYFDRDTIAHVAKSLLASLADDGWIMLGATDPLLSEYAPCEVVQTAAGLAYRRVRSGNAARLATPMSLPRQAPTATPPRSREVALPANAQPPLESPPAAVVERAPSTADHIRQLANAGHLDEAGRECAAALDVSREDPELHYLHAILVAQAGQFDESARAAKRALYLDRAMVVAHAALGTALAKSERAADAQRAFANATRLLEAMPPDAIVPYSDGEPAGRLLEMTRMQSRLAQGEAA